MPELLWNLPCPDVFLGVVSVWKLLQGSLTATECLYEVFDVPELVEWFRTRQDWRWGFWFLGWLVVNVTFECIFLVAFCIHMLQQLTERRRDVAVVADVEVVVSLAVDKAARLMGVLLRIATVWATEVE